MRSSFTFDAWSADLRPRSCPPQPGLQRLNKAAWKKIDNLFLENGGEGEKGAGSAEDSLEKFEKMIRIDYKQSNRHADETETNQRTDPRSRGVYTCGGHIAAVSTPTEVIGDPICSCLRKLQRKPLILLLREMTSEVRQSSFNCAAYLQALA